MLKKVTKIEQTKAASRKRVAAYCRVSTEHEAQMESLKKSDGGIPVSGSSERGLGPSKHLRR